MSSASITVLAENILPVVKTLTKFVPSKPQLPILDSIHVVVANNELRLSATDLYLGITATVPAKVEGEASLAVPAKLLLGTLTLLSAQTIILSIEETTITVKTDSTTSKVQGQSALDYPDFPAVQGKEFVLTAQLLENCTSVVAMSSATDQTRPVLTGMYLDPQPDSTFVVATDGFRLSAWRANQVLAEQPLNIPLKFWQELAQLTAVSKHDSISFLYDDSQKLVLCSVGTMTLFSRVLEGTYPPYQQILPTTFAYELTVDGTELLQYCKQALVFTKDISQVIKFNLSEKQLLIQASSATQSSFEGVLATTDSTIPQQLTVAFNGRYILDYLSRVKPETVTIKCNDSLKPVVFVTPKYPDLTYVAMPFRLNEE
jgi:DNA polymerase-3 subunit beta